MELRIVDRIWNRAALEAGGEKPGPGDRALADLLLAHGLVMNGGVHHALESLSSKEAQAAAAGYAYLGLDELVPIFRDPKSDPILALWTESSEPVANERYWSLVPGDSFLSSRFESVFAERASDFAPI